MLAVQSCELRYAGPCLHQKADNHLFRQKCRLCGSGLRDLQSGGFCRSLRRRSIKFNGLRRRCRHPDSAPCRWRQWRPDSQPAGLIKVHLRVAGPGRQRAHITRSAPLALDRVNFFCRNATIAERLGFGRLMGPTRVSSENAPDGQLRHPGRVLSGRSHGFRTRRSVSNFRVHAKCDA